MTSVSIQEEIEELEEISSTLEELQQLVEHLVGVLIEKNYRIENDL